MSVYLDFLKFSLIVISFSSGLYGQSSSLNAKLGYSENTKLLIIHADDVGVSHSENKATFLAMQAGVVNSASIMMPCPWVPEVAEFYAENPESDFGLHLTLTSEWKTMKWGPVASKDKVPSLLGSDGYLHKNCFEFGQVANAKEAKIELKAQIDLAISLGIKPTHLDSHMGCLLFSSPEVFQAFLELGREYKIPVMVGRFFLKAASPSFLDLIQPEDVVIEKVITANPNDYQNGMAEFYENVLNNLTSGVQILLIHTAFNDAEMQALTVDHPDWGAQWRQEDFDFFTSKKAKDLIKENDIKLVTWREIQNAIYQKK